MERYLYSNHPKYFIHSQIIRFVDELWGIETSPRIVRQNSRYVPVNVEFVDYVFPCFELGNLLGILPTDVAKKLEVAFNNDLSTKRYVTVESVNGYLNFQIDDALLQKGKEAVSYWANYTNSNMNNSVSIIVFDLNKDDEENLGMISTHLPKLYQIFGIEAQIVDIQNSEYAKYRSWLSEGDLSTKHSNLVDEINGVIDDHLKINSNFIHDAKTTAVYYFYDEVAIPVRSSSGKVYPLAFFMYEVDKLVKSYQKQNNDVLIVAQQKNHHLLHSIVSRYPGLTIKMTDLAVMRPDISEYRQSGLSSIDDFLKYLVINVDLLSKNLTQQHERKKYIALIDVSYDILLASKSSALPIVFNCLNETINLFSNHTMSTVGVSHD